ncbi:MAG: hypothetical protein WAU12_02875, partial [Saprospiraceae bacterium]
REAENKEVKAPKIITKILKKSTKSTGKAPVVKDDDLDDLELELDMDDDTEYDSNIVTGMDMDEIADDQDYFDK